MNIKISITDKIQMIEVEIPLNVLIQVLNDLPFCVSVFQPDKAIVGSNTEVLNSQLT